MSLRDAIEGKKQWRAQWRAHMARVKALPQDYQVVYDEIQKYLFKVGPAEPTGMMNLLSGMIDLFEEGAALGKGVLEVTGNDVAAFCDDLIEESRTHAGSYQDHVDQEVYKAIKKYLDKSE